MDNKALDEELYTYPKSNVLRNKLGIRDFENLEWAERKLLTLRVMEGAPIGKFDLDHLRAIHKFLFQDIFEWAGEIRKVDMGKGVSWFIPCKLIETAMHDIHKRIVKQNYLKGMNKDIFAKEAGIIIGDINYMHPFREGNGRTQVHFLKHLCLNAGYTIDITKLPKLEWMQGSIESHRGNYERMSKCIYNALLSE